MHERAVEVPITVSEEIESWLMNNNTRLWRPLVVLHRAAIGDRLLGAECPLFNLAFPHIGKADYSIINIAAKNSDYEEGKNRKYAKGLSVYMPEQRPIIKC